MSKYSREEKVRLGLKFNIMMPNFPIYPLSGIHAKTIHDLVVSKDLVEVGVKESPSPFEKPYSRGFVGSGHGTEGHYKEYVPLYNYMTYDGCRDMTLLSRTKRAEDLILRVTIWNGRTLDGIRDGVRGRWTFAPAEKSWLDIEGVDFIYESIDKAWKSYVSDLFEKHEEVLRKRREEEFGERMISDYVLNKALKLNTD